MDERVKERFLNYANKHGLDLFTAIDFAERDVYYESRDSETEDGWWEEWDGVEFEPEVA